jgi:hypothetical protein
MYVVLGSTMSKSNKQESRRRSEPEREGHLAAYIWFLIHLWVQLHVKACRPESQTPFCRYASHELADSTLWTLQSNHESRIVSLDPTVGHCCGDTLKCSLISIIRGWIWTDYDQQG